MAELKQALSLIYGERLRGLYLYGSYARGDFNQDSDVDVIIALEGPVNAFDEINRYNEVVSDICLRYDLLISTLPVGEDRFNQGIEPLYENVRREGVLV